MGILALTMIIKEKNTLPSLRIILAVDFFIDVLH